MNERTEDITLKVAKLSRHLDVLDPEDLCRQRSAIDR